MKILIKENGDVLILGLFSGIILVALIHHRGTMKRFVLDEGREGRPPVWKQPPGYKDMLEN